MWNGDGNKTNVQQEKQVNENVLRNKPWELSQSMERALA
jgi:hypothetical protein